MVLQLALSILFDVSSCTELVEAVPASGGWRVKSFVWEICSCGNFMKVFAASLIISWNLIVITLLRGAIGINRDLLVLEMS